MEGLILFLLSVIGLILIFIGISIVNPIWAKILVDFGIIVLVGIILFIVESWLVELRPDTDEDNGEDDPNE